jgi:hypothetical protein
VAMRYEEWIRGRLLPRIAGPNPAVGMVICLLLVLCVVRYRSVRRAMHLPRGFLPSVVRLGECNCEALILRGPCPTRICCAMKDKINGRYMPNKGKSHEITSDCTYDTNCTHRMLPATDVENL